MYSVVRNTVNWDSGAWDTVAWGSVTWIQLLAIKSIGIRHWDSGTWDTAACYSVTRDYITIGPVIRAKSLWIQLIGSQTPRLQTLGVQSLGI